MATVIKAKFELSDEEIIALCTKFDIEKPTEKFTDSDRQVLIEKIREKVADKNEEYEDFLTAFRKQEFDPKTNLPKKMTFASLAKQNISKFENTAFRRAMKLVRVRISCNDTNKRNYKGEIFTVQNSVIPYVKKFVPFNAPTHIPQIMYDMIKERQLQIFYEEKSPSGRKVKKSRLIPEYNIELLAPLTAKELNAIKQKQLAENGSIEE